MMVQTALRMKTRVLPNKRIDVTHLDLEEGEEVEIIVLRPGVAISPESNERIGVWDYIQSLPPSTLTMEDWERIEREFREERDSWGD